MRRLSRFLRKVTNTALVAPEPEGMPLAVLEFQSPTAAVIATPLPLLARSANYVVTALVLSMVLISMVMKVDMLVVGNGVLQSVTPDFTIQVFNTSSIVRNILVHPGELVTKGQVLATLDPTYAKADLTSLTQEEQNYSAQVAQLQAQEDNKPYVPDPSNPASVLQMQTYGQQIAQHAFTMQNYDQQINQLKTQIAGFNEQADYYKQRLSIASNVETMRKKLQQLQVGSKLDTEAATDDRVNVQAQLSSAISSAQADERQLAAVQAQRDSADQEWKAQVSTQLATALNSLYQAQQQLAKAKLNNQLVELTAPQDAVVQSVATVAIGSVVQPGQELMDLAPVNAPFIIEADIDASQSGYVHPGTPASIKFSTLDPLLYGTAKGTVISVSAESFNPQDQQSAAVNGAPLPGTPQSLYYKAEISLDMLNLHNVPQGFRLMPGMPLEADLIVGHRSIFRYFFSRLAPMAYNSMHEP